MRDTLSTSMSKEKTEVNTLLGLLFFLDLGVCVCECVSVYFPGVTGDTDII